MQPPPQSTYWNWAPPDEEVKVTPSRETRTGTESKSEPERGRGGARQERVLEERTVAGTMTAAEPAPKEQVGVGALRKKPKPVRRTGVDWVDRPLWGSTESRPNVEPREQLDVVLVVQQSSQLHSDPAQSWQHLHAGEHQQVPQEPLEPQLPKMWLLHPQLWQTWQLHFAQSAL